MSRSQKLVQVSLEPPTGVSRAQICGQVRLAGLTGEQTKQSGLCTRWAQDDRARSAA